MRYFAIVGGICCALLIPKSARALQDGMFGVGFGYFTEDNLGKVTKSETGASSSLGPATYPVILKYDWKTRTDAEGVFLSPTFTYTVIPRSEAGHSAKITTWQFILPLGLNFGEGGLDWHLGVGLINRAYKGAGGTKVLSNGTGTSTFALPGKESVTRNYLWNIGSGFSFSNSRLGLDLIVEGAMSKKRTYDFMLSYTYGFSVGTL